MDLDRARESLRAAELCEREGLVNSAVSRAYYAMFQAAQVVMSKAGFERAEWSHSGLQATFTTELIHRRKVFPAVFRDYLSVALGVRQRADYGAGVSGRVAQRMLRRAASFVASVEEKETRHGEI